MIGRTISHYKILERLGEGGMGVVYKAEDLKLQRPVALKFLPARALGDSEAKERFLREARAAAALQHPNICTVHEIDEEEGQTFIVMAYIDGHELTEEIGEGPLPIARAVDLATQIAQGLEEAHNNGTVHRDVKPANIMVTSQGRAVVMDFGLAQLASSTARLTREGSTVGTSAYMSPEQMGGETVDQRTDIWALGVVLYEMLAGQLPFRGEYEQAIQYSIVYEDPESLRKARPDVPADIENIISKILEKKPAERYQQLGDLIADLQASRTASGTPLATPAATGSSGDPSQPVATGSPVATGTRAGPSQPVGTGSPAGSATTAQPTSRRTLYLATVALAVVAIVLAAWFTRAPDAPAPEPGKSKMTMPAGMRDLPSVAVMPFVNVSGNPDSDYFSDGMTDELINSLGRVHGLRVIGRSSVFRLKDRGLDVGEIGEMLSVDSVLEGTVRMADGRTRITAQLINVEDGFQLWFGQFEDMKMMDAFDIQDQVARAIVENLRVEFMVESDAPMVERGTANEEAYHLYLVGRQQLKKYTEDGYRKGIRAFQQAIEKDPDYADAYGGMASGYTTLGLAGYAFPRETIPKAKQAALRALEIDPNHVQSLYSLGWVLASYEWDWEEAGEVWRRALTLAPGNAEIQYGYGQYLHMLRRLDEALAAAERAVALDPARAAPRAGLSNVLRQVGRYEEAKQTARRLIEVHPDRPEGFLQLGAAQLSTNEFQEAANAFARGAALTAGSAYHEGLLGAVYGRAGREKQAREILNRLIKRRRERYVSALAISFPLIALGESEEAWKWIDKAVEERDGWLGFAKSWPAEGLPLDASNPRYQELLRKLNLE